MKRMFIFKHTLGSFDLLAGVTAPDSYSFLENSNLWKARGAVNGKNCLKKSLTMKREAKMLSLHNIPPPKKNISGLKSKWIFKTPQKLRLFAKTSHSIFASHCTVLSKAAKLLKLKTVFLKVFILRYQNFIKRLASHWKPLQLCKIFARCRDKILRNFGDSTELTSLVRGHWFALFLPESLGNL